MALGPHIVEWAALKQELDRLATSCRAHFVAVMSTGNVLWCSNRFDDELADDFYRGVPFDVAVRLGPSLWSPAEGVGKQRA